MGLRLALVADVHSNLHALQAVLEALAHHEVDRVVCLGDLVGYNAYPSECIALAEQHFDRIVQGNHDREVTGVEPIIGTSSVARIAQGWTQAQLSPDEIGWLASLPNRDIEVGTYMAVHGCYLNEEHVNGYVTQTMLSANLTAVAERPEWPSVAFCGHTHVPMLAWRRAGEVSHQVLGEHGTWPADAEAVLINPGSVGQPRDGDPRAAFAIVDLGERTASVVRVSYDVQGAAAAITAAGLPERLGERLSEGR